MRLLLDINVLLDVGFERPGADASARVIETSGGSGEAWIAWHTLATLSYLIHRQGSKVQAREFISGLFAWAKVSPTTQYHAELALSLPMSDFEDALQSAAAIACDARYIITRNIADFAASPVPALTPEAFLIAFPSHTK
jgi:predicted nucleic acid-binding protein